MKTNSRSSSIVIIYRQKYAEHVVEMDAQLNSEPGVMICATHQLIVSPQPLYHKSLGHLGDVKLQQKELYTHIHVIYATSLKSYYLGSIHVSLGSKIWS